MNNKTLYILMILAMIAWGETWTSAKVLSTYLSSDELIFWRFLFTTLGLIPVLIYFKSSFKISLHTFILSLMSAIMLVFYNYAFFLGSKYGLASFGGVLVTTLIPIITFLLVSILSKKIFKMQEIFGILLGVIGTLIILKIWSFNTNTIFSQGNIYFLLAALLWPILTIISSKQKDSSALIFSFYMFGLTAFFALILLNFSVTNILNFDYIFWVNILLLSLYGTTFATTIYFIAVTELGSKLASSFFFLVPSSAIIFAVLFLNENIELSLIIGGILTIISVYILNQLKTVKIK